LTQAETVFATPEFGPRLTAATEFLTACREAETRRLRQVDRRAVAQSDGRDGRIFMSHSSRDTREAVALKQWLAEQDPRLADEIFLDVDRGSGIRSGTRWVDALRQANQRCEAVICLVSGNWAASAECRTEYRFAENLNKRIFPVRLEPSDADNFTANWLRCDLFGDGPKTEIDIGDGPPVVFTAAGLQELYRGIVGAGVQAESFRWPSADDPDRAPYRGWEALDETDAAIFFGREGAIMRGLDALCGMRFGAQQLAGHKSLFVVLGPSGSGKSSFLRAGLLPRLRRDDRNFVVIDIVRPHRAVLTGDSGLARAIGGTRAQLGLNDLSLGEIKEACAAGADGIARLLREIQDAAAASRSYLADPGTPPTVVLPLDQADELLCGDARAQAEPFFALLRDLLATMNGTDPNFIVAATIRSDRFEALQTRPELADVGIKVFDDIKPMPATRFHQVITGPAAQAARAGRPLGVAPDLVERLLDDCAEGANTLPLLSRTLGWLYVRYGSTGELTLAQYEAMGGIRGIVNVELDSLLAGDRAERTTQLELLRAAFIPWLATINPDDDRPVSRIARWRDLPAESRPLLDELVNQRLLAKDVRGGEVVIGVATESLLRQWEDLAYWLAEERQNLVTAEDVDRNATRWRIHDRNPAWLQTGTRLADAETLSDTSAFASRLAETHDYVSASRQAENERLAKEEEQRQEKLRHAEEVAHLARELEQTAIAHAAELRQRSLRRWWR
jgi:hypothetical protein